MSFLCTAGGLYLHDSIEIDSDTICDYKSKPIMTEWDKKSTAITIEEIYSK